MEISDSNNQHWFDASATSASTISQYFSGLNSSAYAEVAELFSPQGCLHPPFGKSLCGTEEITQYLKTEARGMIACPESATVLSGDTGNVSHQVYGKVRTSFFIVNVSWTIVLNSENKILSARVKLLEQLQDLLVLKKIEAD